MGRPSFTTRSRNVALALALAWLTIGSTRHATGQAADGLPVQIREGSCDHLGPVAFELTGVGASVDPDGTPVPVGEIVGSDKAVPLQVSETTLSTHLSKLVDDPFAIAVYASEAADASLLACGDVGGPLSVQMAGMVMSGDELAIGLAAVDDSGYSGLALVQAQGTEATVRLFLLEGAGGS